MIIKLYVEPLYVLADYWFAMERKHRFYEMWFPIILGMLAEIYTYYHIVDTYMVVEHVQSIITTLLGFTLTAMAIFIAGGDKCELTKSYITDVVVRNRKCTLYDLMILNYSYQVTVEFLLCIAYVIGLCVPNSVSARIADMFNIFFVVIALSISLSALRSVTDLYWIFIAKKNPREKNLKNV